MKPKLVSSGVATVVSVFEKFENGRGYIDDTGASHVETKSLGWHIRIGEGSAIYVGDKEPDVKVGDEIVLLLFKREKQLVGKTGKS